MSRNIWIVLVAAITGCSYPEAPHTTVVACNGKEVLRTKQTVSVYRGEGSIRVYSMHPRPYTLILDYIGYCNVITEPVR